MSDPQQQPKPATDKVNLTIDGRPVTVAKGTNVIEAARELGIEISAFCYHPGLQIVAVCRQCLVSVEGNPKLQPSCQAVCTEGMVVHTADKTSRGARRHMHDLTQVKHPIDCQIVDKAGECTLQQLYFGHDNVGSRVDTPKVRKPKVVDLGPHIVLDAERCILCTRCIRVCDEVAGVHQLEMKFRGDHEEITTAPGAQLDNPYSLNTVDVCPVGALTSKDFRFTMRAWELNTTPSVCQGCATGCSMEIHHKQDRVWRLVPRHNSAVNGHWMCDEGRFTYHELKAARLATPVVNGLPSRWDAALTQAANALDAVRARSVDAIGVVFSPRHTNEDNYALARLARDIWGLKRFYVGGRGAVPERADKVLRDADINANRRGVDAILGAPAGDAAQLARDLAAGELQGLLVLGQDTGLDPDAIKLAAALDALVVIADRELDVAAAADIALPCASWAEVSGTVTNRQGIVQRMHAAFEPSGQALPAWAIITALAQASGAVLGYTHPRQVFDEMIGKVGAFASGQWGRDARPIQLRFAHSRG
jgi:NADH-quinone oxidoreductase subunit G